jgi:hypothetical protein
MATLSSLTALQSLHLMQCNNVSQEAITARCGNCSRWTLSL